LFFYVFISYLTSRLWGILEKHIHTESWIAYFSTYHLFVFWKWPFPVLYLTISCFIPLYYFFFLKKSTKLNTELSVISSKLINISMETSTFNTWLASICLRRQWNIRHGNISIGNLSSSAFIFISIKKVRNWKPFWSPKRYGWTIIWKLLKTTQSHRAP